MNLTGKIVRLRPIQFSDSDILCVWKNEEELYKYLGGGYHPISPDQYKEWMKGMVDQTGASRRFIIETLDSRALGMIGLYSINWIHRTCEIGAYIADNEYRGKGIATEAYLLIESYAKNYLNLRKITLNVVEDNISGKAFWLKNGFAEVGKLTKERFIEGKYCDLLIMEKFI